MGGSGFLLASPFRSSITNTLCITTYFRSRIFISSRAGPLDVNGTMVRSMAGCFKAQDRQFKNDCLSASSCHCGPTTSYCQADAGVIDDNRSGFF